MFAIAVNALYTTLRKRGTTRQLAGAIVASVISALLLLPALFWYNLRFSAEQAALSVLEIGLMLLYVAFCGWIFPFGITTFYCLFTRPRDSNTAGRLQGQRKRITRARAEAVSVPPPRRQPGVASPFVYSADHPWGWLVYRNGKFVGQELALTRSIASVGREEDNEVWLDDDTISRYHAELAWDKGQVYVTDNGSLNGVLLNGRHIRSSTLVKSGDELEIGAHRFMLKYAEQPVSRDELDDPLLPQLRRVSASRAGTSSPGKTPEGKQPLAPTAALKHSQEEPLRFSPFYADPEDIAWQDTVEFARERPLPLPEEPGGLCLICSGEMTGRSFLLDQPVLTVGRDPGSAVVIYDPSIAPHHARFLHQAHGDYVQDLAGFSQSRVNGMPLNTPHLLRQGDIITLGDVRIEYTLLPEAQTRPMPLSSPLPPPFDPPPSPRLPGKF
jgi:pSer/pThr/pTyr-binding forkhead associated (FHA) protein